MGGVTAERVGKRERLHGQTMAHWKQHVQTTLPHSFHVDHTHIAKPAYKRQFPRPYIHLCLVILSCDTRWPEKNVLPTLLQTKFQLQLLKTLYFTDRAIDWDDNIFRIQILISISRFNIYTYIWLLLFLRGKWGYYYFFNIDLAC